MRKLFIWLLATVAMPLHAQFTEVDWGTAKGDTLLPVCSAVVPLPADYASYEYSAIVEYPEYKAMSAEEVARYRLQQRAGEFGETPRVETYVSVAAKEPMLDVAFLPVIYSGGKFMRIDSYKLVISRKAVRASRAKAAVSPRERYAASSLLAEGRWVKIRVSESGVHAITSSQLSNMGFKNPAKVRLYGYGGNMLPETNIHETIDDLCEVPLWRENGRLLFYAFGPTSWNYSSGRYVHRHNVYSKYAYYFLAESDEEPMEFPVSPELTDYATVCKRFPDYALYEKDETTLFHYGNVLFDKYNFAQGRTKSYTFDLPGCEGTNMVVDVSFGSSAEENSRLAVDVNGTVAGNISVPRASSTDLGRIATGRYNTSSAAEKTIVKLTHGVSNANQSGHLDYIRLNFTRALSMRASQMNFRGGSSSSANALFEISGASASLRVWHVASPAAISQLPGSFAGDVYSVVASARYDEEYVALNTDGNFPMPEVVGEVPNQNLHSLGQTDMVIIVPSSGKFLPAAERLAAAHREHDGITVAVVTAAQVYNEFSSGTPDATAYRRLMKMLYDRAATPADAPKYLLLFGDGFVDNRLFSYRGRNADDYLLCYESDNSVSAVFSYVLEDYYGFLDDAEGGNHTRDKVDIGVGRIPAQTVHEAHAVVDKIVGYMENSEAGAWQNVIALLGDDGDKDIPNQHMKDAEGVATILGNYYPSYIIDRIYWDNYEPVANSTGNSYPLVTSAIYNRLNEGALVVNYSGHGSSNVLSHEMAWLVSDMQAISSPRLPFWVTASCDIGPFDMGDNSLAEAALLNPNGAAVGLLTTTRTVLQVYNAIINKEFMKVLLSPTYNGRKQAVGDALRRAKNNVITLNSDLSENKLQFVLLGDPALRLKLPEYRFEVETFNGKPATEISNIPAGGILNVEGRVVGGDGEPVTDFTGLLTSTLYDSAEDVLTRDNLGLGTFEYTAYNRKLSSGSDSVKNGYFSINMPVPVDISYSGEPGMLYLFAVDNAKDRLAQGSYTNFNVESGAAIDNDGKGPEIKLYLNTPSFADGGEVNTTPCLYAEFFDENGINTAGTSIGHDVMLIVDNDPAHTYNLNSVYKPVPGDYKRGTVAITLNELDAGEHKLLLRAWDLLNNSSVAELSFMVVPGLAPSLAKVELAPNPLRAGQQAQFILSHNFPGSEIDVTIEVYNFQGQVLWKNTERGVCAGNTYVCDWNGAGPGGQPLPTGVYLYRASLSSGGGKAVTEAGKFILLGNK